MAVSKEFLEDVLNDLRFLGEIESKRMFGGYGLYSDGLFFGLLSQDMLFFKVGEAGRAECEEAGIPAFDPYGDGKGMSSYFEVPSEVRSKRKELKRWFERALAEAAKKKPKKKSGLAALRNIGPVSRPWLKAVGVKSLADLEERGAVDIFLAVRESGVKVSVNLLYALEGARTDRHWNKLSPAERSSLKQRAGLES